MPRIVWLTGLVPALTLSLAACTQNSAPSGQAVPTTPQDRLYACQMKGAEAEDRVYGPLGDLSVDSALVRARVTDDCLKGRPSPVIIGTPGLG